MCVFEFVLVFVCVFSFGCVGCAVGFVFACGEWVMCVFVFVWP